MSIYDTLNPMQKEAVFHTDGPLLILAGAGSGKTRVLTHRIAYLIEEQGVNPWNILAITFTNKAAQEMRDRVDKLVGFGSESIWVATFHATCVRILRRHCEEIGYERNFSIYDTDDQKTVMRQVLKKLEMDPKLYKDRMMLSAISAAKNAMITPEQMDLESGSNFRQRQIARIYREYQVQLKKNNAMDFDDLLMKTVELFSEHLDILELYQERFRYMMVDEYQDTNAVQFRFLKLLANKYQNLCVVGDDDQSIYKFRGADITNILSFEETFPNTHVVKLEQNYRSTTAILEVANNVIQNNTGRKAKRLWSEKKGGETVRLKQFGYAAEEAETVVGEIARLHREGACDYRDCAILYRTNAQSRSFEEACVAHSVPYRLIGGVNFYQRMEIKDILAYLKTIDNGRDDLAVRRILNVPKRGIGLTSMDRAQDFAERNDMSFFEVLEVADQIPGLTARAVQKMKAFSNKIAVLRSQREYMGPAELIEEVIDQIEYMEYLAGNDDEEQLKTRQENLDELISKARTFEEEAETDVTDEDGGRNLLSRFLEDVALVADIDNLDPEADYVVLMTLHGAKGLEFPRVYMTGMEDGLLPSQMAVDSDDPDAVEEERRLCYVGMTRAMEHLTLTAAKIRMNRGETHYHPLSRFLAEIPPELLDGGQSVSGAKKLVDDPPFAPVGHGFGGGYSSRKASTPFGPGVQKGFGVKSSFGKEFTVEKNDSLDYGVGDRVSHIKFGEGTVTSIVEGKRDFEVTVDFDGVGQKRMFAGFAKLQKKE